MAERKDGRYYLKKKYEEELREHNALEEKYEALKREHEDLQKSYNLVIKTQGDLQETVEKQAAEISKLNYEIHNTEARRIKESVEHEKLVDELFEHMGWFRRLIWRFEHAEQG